MIISHFRSLSNTNHKESVVPKNSRRGLLSRQKKPSRAADGRPLICIMSRESVHDVILNALGVVSSNEPEPTVVFSSDVQQQLSEIDSQMVEINVDASDLVEDLRRKKVKSMPPAPTDAFSAV